MTKLLYVDRHIEPVSEYAPKRDREPEPDVVEQEQPHRGYIGLTAEALAPDGEMGDAMRIAQMVAPALEQIGTNTADQIEATARLMMDHAEAAAKLLIEEAQRQADKMIADAERITTNMKAFATDIRTFTMAKAAQTEAFSSMTQSVMASMYALGDHFVANQKREIEYIQKQVAEAPQDIPAYLKRAVKNLKE